MSGLTTFINKLLQNINVHYAELWHINFVAIYNLLGVIGELNEKDFSKVGTNAGNTSITRYR